MQQLETRIYRFAEMEVNPQQSCLRRNGQEQHLRRKTFQVLLCLLEARDRLVTKEELVERVWGDTAVTDDAVVKCIVDLRKALGDDSHQPRFIKTVSKGGYRFIAPVEEIEPAPAIEPSIILASNPVHPTKGLNGAEELTRAAREVQEIEEAHSEKDSIGVASFLHRLSLSPRRKIILLIALFVVVGSGVIFYRSRNPQLAEVTLPQTPGKRAVAVLYFENRSQNRELDWLREGLADMLIANLSRAQKLAVLSRQQLAVLLDRAGHPTAAPLRLEESLEIARKAQADVLALGGFVQLGEKVRLDVQLHDARTGQLLTTESLTADRLDMILSQMDLLSLKLTQHLGVAPSEPQAGRGLAAEMTTNLDAYRYYSLALEKAHAYHSREAIRLWEQAIALDPQFAMAYARIGYTYAVVFVNAGEKAKPYLEKALQLSTRLSEKDRFYIHIWDAIARQDAPATIRLLRSLVAQYPYEVEAYLRLGYMLRGQGQYRESIEVFKQGLVIDPDAPDLHNALGFSYDGNGQHAEAMATHQRYVQLAPKEPNAHDSLGMTYIGAGRYDEALTAFQQALALNPKFHFANLHLADVYFLQGRYRAAVQQYQQYLQFAPSAWDRAVGYHRLVLLYWKKGDLQAAAVAAEQELKNQNDFGGAFLVALARGDLPKAAGLNGQFFASSNYAQTGTTPSNNFLCFFRGYDALKSGNASAAIQHFQEALRFPQARDVESTVDCLANAYLELGRLDEAIAEYERVLRFNPNYPLAQYHLGQAYERKGERMLARSAFTQFLEIWKEADADIPAVIDAKKRLADFAVGD